MNSHVYMPATYKKIQHTRAAHTQFTQLHGLGKQTPYVNCASRHFEGYQFVVLKPFWVCKGHVVDF
jgi:hypothetical protein